jgi:hypothetical protein
MWDFACLAALVAFFIVAWGFAVLCGRVMAVEQASTVRGVTPAGRRQTAPALRAASEEAPAA